MSESKKKLQEYAANYSTKAEWEKRAAAIREGMLKKMGLSPLPSRASLNADIHDKRAYNGYTVENVYFESFPGYFVCGNLYRPASGDGPFPGILTPHGHWKSPTNYGRFRKNKQMNNATLARMGAVVFTWDLVGYGESTQTNHCFKELMALQTWNTIRSVDFLLSLPDVDSAGIGISGASGGGTQTFMAAALDGRISVSVPVAMVSAGFFGGCIGESGMGVHDGDGYETNNAEIAAMAAPRPLLLVSDGGDWTNSNPDVEYPYVRNIYKLYNAEDMVENFHQPDGGHNLGPGKRVGIYAFLKKHFNLSDAPDEDGNTLEPYDSLRVWSHGRKWPDYALKTDEAIKKGLYFTGTYGCKDESKSNYNPDADVHDPAMCREAALVKRFTAKYVSSRRGRFVELRFNFKPSRPLKLDVVHLNGEVTLSLDMENIPGAKDIVKFKMPSLPAGLYLLRARSGADIQVGKLLIP